MSDATNSTLPHSSGEEFCLNDILDSSSREHDRNSAAPSDEQADLPAPYSAKDEISDLESACEDASTDAVESSQAQPSAEPSHTEPPADRRKRRRALISALVRVRGINVTDGGVDEISTSIDVSRAGILFVTSSPAYNRGMQVAVIFPYSSAPTALHAEQPGRVVRAFEMPDGRYSVAIALGEGVGEDLVDSCGRKLNTDSVRVQQPRETASKRPLVLVVDSDETTRETLKTYLTEEGYDIMAVSSCPDAREVLSMFTPALLISEVEGDGLPGYDLCAHVKANPRLKRIPVVLTTSSGYPSDYANAHSLGAVVCMTKPYKQERLGHVVRLLAPPAPEFCNHAAPRAADPTRRPGCANPSRTKSAPGGLRRFRFPSFR